MSQKEKVLELDANIEVDKCDKGHFRAKVVFKLDGKVIHESVSPCFDTQDEVITAANTYCRAIAPVLIKGLDAELDNSAQKIDNGPNQYLH